MSGGSTSAACALSSRTTSARMSGGGIDRPCSRPLASVKSPASSTSGTWRYQVKYRRRSPGAKQNTRRPSTAERLGRHVGLLHQPAPGDVAGECRLDAGKVLSTNGRKSAISRDQQVRRFVPPAGEERGYPARVLLDALEHA